ncbi:MAG: hypothetical protein ACQEQF_06420, partial [Bacillota bacterium]
EWLCPRWAPWTSNPVAGRRSCLWWVRFPHVPAIINIVKLTLHFWRVFLYCSVKDEITSFPYFILAFSSLSRCFLFHYFHCNLV